MDRDRQNSDAFPETASGSIGRTAALAPLAQSNGGGTAIAQPQLANPAQGYASRLVIRGESSWHQVTGDDGETYLAIFEGGRGRLVHLPQPKQDTDPYTAITDYLNCTFPFSGRDLGDFFFELLDCLGPKFGPVRNRQRGIHGWDHSYALGESSALFGLGGQNGTGFLSLPGEACHQVPNWQRLINFLDIELGGRITRWDGAVDDYSGVHNVDWAVKLYLSGQFTAGGNRPSCSQKGNWIEPDGRGRTFYVGKRENGKMVRIYEKGMQLGARFHPWVRWEVEMHNTDRIIPWKALLEPGKFVAGAYPKALDWIEEEMQRIKTVQTTAKIGYDHLTRTAATAYGKLINVMLEVEGSAEKVVEKLIRDGVPSRLRLPTVPKGEGRS